MSESNYTRLTATLSEVIRKTKNEHFVQSGNKVNNLQSKVVAIYKDNEAGSVQAAHWQQLRQSMLTQQELDGYRMAGLNDGDIKAMEELVNVKIRADYARMEAMGAELEELRAAGKPEAVSQLKAELDEVLSENSRLADEIEHMLIRERMIVAAADMEAEHPGTLAAIKRVLNKI